MEKVLKSKNMKYLKKAFTLIEMIVVVFIIGVLVTVAVNNISDSINKSKMTNAFKELATIENAVGEFNAATGEVPVDLDNVRVTTNYFKDYYNGGNLIYDGGSGDDLDTGTGVVGNKAPIFVAVNFNKIIKPYVAVDGQTYGPFCSMPKFSYFINAAPTTPEVNNMRDSLNFVYVIDRDLKLYIAEDSASTRTPAAYNNIKDNKLTAAPNVDLTNNKIFKVWRHTKANTSNLISNGERYIYGAISSKVK